MKSSLSESDLDFFHVRLQKQTFMNVERKQIGKNDLSKKHCHTLGIIKFQHKSTCLRI
jgi:hypothetical protein